MRLTSDWLSRTRISTAHFLPPISMPSFTWFWICSTTQGAVSPKLARMPVIWSM